VDATNHGKVINQVDATNHGKVINQVDATNHADQARSNVHPKCQNNGAWRLALGESE
jgi:hypothetical protein